MVSRCSGLKPRFSAGCGATGTLAYTFTRDGDATSAFTANFSVGGTATFTMSGSGLANFPALQIGGAGTTHLNGGTLATGGYPGRARNGDEMRADLDLEGQ